MSVSKLNPLPGLSTCYMGFGVVEDRNDPLKMGRARVRVFGIHPEQTMQDATRGMSTSELPWYPMINPSFNGSGSGLGHSQAAAQPGTFVLMMFLDEFAQKGFILGSMYTNPGRFTIEEAFTGFQDPSGMYPTQLGSSLSHDMSIAQGAEHTVNNNRRNNNLGVAIQPDGSVPGNQPVDDNPAYSLYEMLYDDEGYRAVAYYDVKGWSIGVGHFIGELPNTVTEELYRKLSSQIGREIPFKAGIPPSIDKSEGEKLFQNDMKKVISSSTSGRFPLTAAAVTAAGDNKPRAWALMNMSFQLGAQGLENFTTTLTLAAAGKWQEAAAQSLKSLWANQTPGRARKVAACLSTGNMASYGVMPDKE